MSLNIDSLMIMDLLVTKGNIHDSRVSYEMVDSVRNFSDILGDSAYDTSDIYDYVFENTPSIIKMGNKPREIMKIVSC